MKDIILFLPPELETASIVRLLSAHHILLTNDVKKATVIIDLNDIDSSLRKALEKKSQNDVDSLLRQTLENMHKAELPEIPMLLIPEKDKKIYPKEKFLCNKYAKINNSRNNYIRKTINIRHK